MHLPTWAGFASTGAALAREQREGVAGPAQHLDPDTQLTFPLFSSLMMATGCSVVQILFHFPTAVHY